ncbi:hypothetical protein [Rhizobium fabae]|uniref:Uncharacterized protein n=1 Tax=Rhizobium fabae TaxID=573179 RepID=A0A7W6FIA3_9HYPH|nr:hypothetical protein [Rhizobium fabae]MBB3914241.1 hypothetical protein [Rhizobium fabae]
MPFSTAKAPKRAPKGADASATAKPPRKPSRKSARFIWVILLEIQVSLMVYGLSRQLNFVD